VLEHVADLRPGGGRRCRITEADVLLDDGFHEDADRRGPGSSSVATRPAPLAAIG
jgi:hypothetical protein